MAKVKYVYNVGRKWHYEIIDGKKTRVPNPMDSKGTVIAYPARVINVADPENNTDAVNKEYIDILENKIIALEARVTALQNKIK